MHLDEFLGKFPNVRKTGDGYQTKCLAHNGKGDVSLSIKEGSEGNILINCFGGCTPEQVVTSVGLKMSDLFSGNGDGSTKTKKKQISASTSNRRKPFHHPELGDPVKKYPYRNEKGTLLYWICRFEPGLNGEKKAIRPCRPSGLKWGIGDMRRVLYRLPEIIDAKHVVLVEGEKDCDSLVDLGFLSTAFAFGAGGFKSGEYTKSLAGKTVYVLFDNDETGIKKAKEVAGCLKGVATSVRILEVDGMQPGWDITDYLHHHGKQTTAQAITTAISKSTEYIEDNKTDTSVGTIEVVSFAEIEKREFEDNPIIKGLLDEKETLIVAGDSGVGKSILLNQITLDLAHPPVDGLWGLFNIPNPVPSVIVQSENSAKAQNKRLRMLFADNANMRIGSAQVFIARLQGGDDIRFVGDLASTKFQGQLCEAITLTDAKLIVIDPLISYHDADENSNMEMRNALDCLQIYVLDRTGASAIICHHFNKQGETRGASAIRDWTANLLLLEVVKKQNDGSAVIKVTHDKARNFPQVKPFYLERTPNLDFIPTEKPESKKDQQIESAVNALAELGGRCESQEILKAAIMKELNCKESTARRSINDALNAKKILIDPENKKGKAIPYFLPE